MRDPLRIQFEVDFLPDAILPKLIEGFRRSTAEIYASLADQLEAERDRRELSATKPPAELVLPLMDPTDSLHAKAELLVTSGWMLKAAESEPNTLAHPNKFQIAAEFSMSIVHALERQDRFFTAAHTAN